MRSLAPWTGVRRRDRGGSEAGAGDEELTTVER